MPQKEVGIQDLVPDAPGRERAWETWGGKSCVWKENGAGKVGTGGEEGSSACSDPGPDRPRHDRLRIPSGGVTVA